MTQEQDPLWQAILHAYDQSSVPDELLESADAYDCLTDRYGYAAEIRALRDVVVTEEAPYVMVFPSVPDNPVDLIQAACRAERQRLRDLLTAEAERAEKGE
jgi:hypothetical protein